MAFVTTNDFYGGETTIPGWLAPWGAVPSRSHCHHYLQIAHHSARLIYSCISYELPSLPRAPGQLNQSLFVIQMAVANLCVCVYWFLELFLLSGRFTHLV